MTKPSEEVLEWLQYARTRVRGCIDAAQRAKVNPTDWTIFHVLDALCDHPDYGRDAIFRNRISTIRKQFEA